MEELEYGSLEWWHQTVNIGVLQEILDRFAQILNCGTVLTTALGVPITTPSNFTRFCRLMRSTEEGRRLCWESDAAGGRAGLEQGKVRIYRCHAGLIDMALPVVIEGRLAGVVLCGQVKLRHYTRQEVEELAGVGWQNLSNRDELLDLFMEAPVVPREVIDQGGELIKLVSSHVVELCERRLAEKKLLVKDLVLMREKCDKQSLERNLKISQIKALRHQLNPHFMFNTLNAIVRLAMFEDAPETEALAYRFSQYLRYVLRRQSREELVPLAGEVECVEHFLSINKIRFSDRFDFDLHVDPGTRDVRVPFMILQPLVENAIVHGVEPSTDRCHLSVDASIEEGSLVVTVSDDGVGFDCSNFSPGVGVSNVMERLDLHYGKEGCLRWSSCPGDGSRFEVTMPLRRGEEVTG
ncbi:MULTISPECIES: PocR ligand-binding domain-containing protein [Dethiosulfovibrio]|uniref:histidine kinase n=2 Tax=Dethiosulfovibrio TaxID=47054 RepID=A0ABS9EJ75_9BACT|nr:MULTISPECIES: PocR ligand-binding domain-containing protein [Dethiosulfovibrio]MCF4112797.1 PocR ligand-binding domain-containing protein [Dethiosulfovibrio russensis]MCF4141261.1 PocR ligand-binding domain-containing protein [Dethiosulfovibrio marinus]MCF4144947.1 PocR ligand-binding domain-containing protein [Dethiosulfovibrio acidaminovorans]